MIRVRDLLAKKFDRLVQSDVSLFDVNTGDALKEIRFVNRLVKELVEVLFMYVHGYDGFEGPQVTARKNVIRSALLQYGHITVYRKMYLSGVKKYRKLMLQEDDFVEEISDSSGEDSSWLAVSAWLQGEGMERAAGMPIHEYGNLRAFSPVRAQWKDSWYSPPRPSHIVLSEDDL
uniref:Uncharacterized protein n=1 Tax=Chromera velia CCMP2878 TaxID=1169474 RepID=A0A0G4GY00_9ALVE|eukprot:Cvel_5385.t1-p1 / transcript=Cvel_5385.t1 / gene=Cvel_5385 / organism=Chromera_velia_CCMP2878 / gene_product=hypothetical protein / transcript_product=hypothetical protein / location=Cvel_scaffold250:85653-86174(+) / protein_length=174 / sequence_SO=supercontig / SO=protein_coding / is_pseudo=false